MIIWTSVDIVYFSTTPSEIIPYNQPIEEYIKELTNLKDHFKI